MMRPLWQILPITLSSASEIWSNVSSKRTAIVRAFGHELPESRQMRELAIWLSTADAQALAQGPVPESLGGHLAFSGALIEPDGRICLLGTNFRILAGDHWLTDPPPETAFTRIGIKLALINAGRIDVEGPEFVAVPDNVDIVVVTDLGNYRRTAFEAWFRSWRMNADLMGREDSLLADMKTLGHIEHGSITILCKSGTATDSYPSDPAHP